MNSFSGGTPEASRLARLEMNSRLYTFDATLEAAANLYDEDVAAWQRLPVILQDRSGLYRDARDQYRRAVAAGAVVDDRGPSTEGTTSW